MFQLILRTQLNKSGCELIRSALRNGLNLAVKKPVSKCLVTNLRTKLGTGLTLSLISSGIYVVKAESKEIKKDLVQENLIEKEVVLYKNEHFTISKLWALLGQEKFWLLIAVASAFVVALLNIQIPLNLGELTNVLSKFLPNKNVDQDVSAHFDWADFGNKVREPAIRLVAMYGLQGLFTFVNISSLTIAGERIATRIKCDLFDSIIKQDIEFFDSNQSGEVLNRLSADVQDFKSAFKQVLSQGLKSITQSLGCAYALYIISPKMTLLMASVVSSLIVIGSFIGAFLRVMSRRAQNQIGKTISMASESISNVRIVRAFAMEDRTNENFAQQVKLGQKYSIELGLGIGVFQSLTNLALNGIVLGTLLYGGHLLSNQELSAGHLMSFLVATQTVQRSLAQLSLLYGQYMKMLSSGERIFEYLHLEPKMSISGVQLLHNVTGHIQFNDVNFRYPSRPLSSVLNGLTLDLQPGKVTAVCGLSGAGKTTLALLLERFYDVASGSVKIDGVDIREIDPKQLRGELISYINQEPVLFATTIEENIKYGKPEATRDEVIKAAKLANCDQFIRTFKDEYQTMCGERGVTLSGGQKQRIAIARAILKNSPILILDEATSALDAQSERLVQDALEKVAANRTVLIIAHRLSTIRDADLIAVLSRGKLVELGTHKQLIERKGLYWDLVRAQHEEGR